MKTFNFIEFYRNYLDFCSNIRILFEDYSLISYLFENYCNLL